MASCLLLLSIAYFRETLGVQDGDRVRYVIADGEVHILPVRPISRLFGVLQHDGPAVTVKWSRP